MTSIGTALGLLYAPMLGASVAGAFTGLGPDAIFGPGCGDGEAIRSIQAPARWVGRPAAAAMALGSTPLTVMAQIRGNRVSSVHLAQVSVGHMTRRACRARLEALPGVPITAAVSGSALVYERQTAAIAGNPARYRAIFRPSLGDCRVMLTIGG